MKHIKIIIAFIVLFIVLLAFFTPKPCSQTGGIIFEGSIFKTCTCLGLILNPQNPLAYTKQCYGVPISYSCKKWVGDNSAAGGKFVNISCE